jgi:hypothetical protein
MYFQQERLMKGQEIPPCRHGLFPAPGAAMRGLTLAELIVASFLSLIVMSLVFALFVPAKLSTITGDNKAEVNMNAHRSITRLSHELRASSPSSITYVNPRSPNEPAAISFMTAYNRDGLFVTGSSGKPLWQGYVIYYLPAGGNKILRKTVDVSPPTASPSRLTLPELLALCDGNGMPAAFDAYTFRIEPQGAYTNYVDISVGARLTYSNRENSLMTEARIFPRN